MKRNIIYIVVGIIVAVLMGIFFYHGEEKSTPPSHVTDNGAEIEVPEGAVGFGCSCGCQDEGGDGVCRCENCDMHEDKEEVKEPEVIYFENPDENDEAAFIHTKDLIVEPLTEEKVDALVEVITSCKVFGVRRCEATIIDNAVDDPKFNPISEAKYIYDASTGRVSNVKGEDITDVISFSVKKCKNGYDFLKAYFTYRGIPYDFMTTDTSHKWDLLLNQRVYALEGECAELERMTEDLSKEVGAFTVTETDCTYQIKTNDYGVDQIIYITLTVAGEDANGATVIKYVTYTLDYDGILED